MKDNFRTPVSEEYLSEPAHRVRWQKTIEFVGRSGSSRLLTAPALSGLDLGDRTPLTASLEQLFGCSFESTTIDLDVEPLSGSYAVVTAFEVLEHLYKSASSAARSPQDTSWIGWSAFCVDADCKAGITEKRRPFSRDESRRGALAFQACRVPGGTERPVSYPSPVVLSYRSKAALAGMV